MSVRLKTIFVVALIQGCLLTVLVWSSISYIIQSNEEALMLRAQFTATTLANLTRTTVQSGDLVGLEAIVEHAVASPGIAYIRVSDNHGILMERSKPDTQTRSFVQHEVSSIEKDSLFDVAADIKHDDILHGRVELGLSVERVPKLVAEARNELIGTASITMVAVVLLLFVLGSRLTRGLNRFTQISHESGGGALDTQSAIGGDGELTAVTSERISEVRGDMARNGWDIDDQARCEQQKQQRLTTILDTVANGFIIFDGEGVIDDINSVGADLFGYQPEELMRRDLAILVDLWNRVWRSASSKVICNVGRGEVQGRTTS